MIPLVVTGCIVGSFLLLALGQRVKNYAATIRDNQTRLDANIKKIQTETSKIKNETTTLTKQSKANTKKIADIQTSLAENRALSAHQNVYAVGTGRCGSKSLAAYMNGLHEPAPNIIFDAYEASHGVITDDLMKKLTKRKSLAANVLSDNRQSFVIPQIREIDPLAKIIVLIREPRACIDSFYARGAYSESEKSKSDMLGYIEHRITPIDGFPEGMTDYMKSCWYYLYTYKRIFSTISGDYEILLTKNIPGDVKNKSRKEQKARLAKYKPTKEEEEYLKTQVIPYYEHILSLDVPHTTFED